MSGMAAQYDRDSPTAETSLADYSNFQVDYSFLDNQTSNQVFQPTFYASNPNSSVSGFENGYQPVTHQLQQQARSQFQRSSSSNLHNLVQSSLRSAHIDLGDDVSNSLQPGVVSTTAEALRQPDIDSFPLNQLGSGSATPNQLDSWLGNQQTRGILSQAVQQQSFNNMGWSQLQQITQNVSPIIPSTDSAAFSRPIHQFEGQSHLSPMLEKKKSGPSSTSDNEMMNVGSRDAGDIQREEQRRRASTVSLDPKYEYMMQEYRKHDGKISDHPKEFTGMLLKDYESKLAASMKKSPQQTGPTKQQPLDGEMVHHTHTGSWNDSPTSESTMVSSSPSKPGINSGFNNSPQLRELTNSPRSAATAPGSAQFQKQQQQQQQQLQSQPAQVEGSFTSQQERGLHLVNLLVSCADEVANKNRIQAKSLLNQLSNLVSPYGDSIQRVASYFTFGLVAQITPHASSSNIYRALRIKEPTPADMLDAFQVFSKVCPFMRFGEVAAVQATLEAFQGEQDVHWIDLSMVPGSQSLWLSYQLLQCLANRTGGPPKMIHFTGILAKVNTSDDQIGRVLKEFAESLNLNFIFQPVSVEKLEHLQPWMLTARTGQVVAVNCSAKLHTLLYDDAKCFNHVMAIVHNLSPRIMCVLEQEASHNVPAFLARFLEALHFYSAIFDSLEATLTRVSPERAKVEQLWLGQEIINIISGEGKQWAERHERWQHWRSRMAKAGYQHLPLSETAVAQVKSLRSISTGTGFTILDNQGSLMLNWQDRPLFSSSTWSC